MNKILLIAIDDIGNECIESDLNEEEAMANMEGELISALEEIDRIILKKRKEK